MQERNLCSQGIVALALCSIGFVTFNVAIKLKLFIFHLSSCSEMVSFLFTFCQNERKPAPLDWILVVLKH